MAEKTLGDAVKAKGGSLVLIGILIVVLGFLAMLCPFWTGMSIALLVGILVLMSGVAQCIFAFQAASFGSGLITFLLGALTVVCGGLMIAHPLLGLTFLTILLAAYFIVEGIFEAVFAFQLRPEKGWGWMLFSGVISLILGILIFQKLPFSTAWVVGILVGIKLLFLGTSLIAIGSAARGAVDAAQDATGSA